jgi:exoribonuclease R
MSERMEQLEQLLDDTLTDFQEAIGELREKGELKKSVTSLGQLARILERVAAARRELEPQKPEKKIPVDEAKRLEALRALVEFHAESLGYVKRE